MNGRELRLGNLVEAVTHSGKHICYDIVNKIDDINYGNYPSSYCKPIKLTEEWLIKLGFDAKTYKEHEGLFNFWNKTMDASIDVELVSEKESIFYYKQNNTTLRSLMYVHQLQNIYHSLKDKELLIK